MRVQLLSFILLTGFLSAQDTELSEIAKTAFPIRLTPAEEAGETEPSCPAPAPKCCVPKKTCAPSCGSATQRSSAPSCYDTANNCPMLEPRRPCERCWKGPYFFADWIFWQTRQDGMQYATRYKPLDGDMGSARTLELNFGWDSGWRVGAGYDTPHDDWDVTFEFTRFCPETHSHSHSGREIVIYPYLLYQGNAGAPATTIVDEASGKWSISFNTWELDFGRKIMPSDCFTFRPHIGIKGARIDQKATVRYTGTRSVPPDPTAEFEVRFQHYFNGFGVRGGFDSNWALGYGFSIFGNASGALLWGSYKSNQNQTLLGFPSIGYADTTKSMKPMMEGMLGISWDRSYYCDRFMVGIDAALETQYWWGQNVYERFTSGIVPTSVKTVYDLGFLGLTLGLRFGF